MNAKRKTLFALCAFASLAFWIGCVDTTDTYTLVAVASPANGGTVSPAKFLNVASGTAVDILATAADGYEFKGWTVTSGSLTIISPSNGYTSVIVRSDAGITAKFELQADTATPPPPPPPPPPLAVCTLTVVANPPSGGSVTPAVPPGVSSGTAVDITATADSGYTFLNWTVTSGTAAFADPGSETTTVTISSNASIAANFGRQGDTLPPPPPPPLAVCTLTVAANPPIGGTVTPASRPDIAAGTLIDVSASPAGGYRFVSWTVTSGVASVAAPNNTATTVTVSATATVTANFQRIQPQFTVTFNTNGGVPEIVSVMVDEGGTMGVGFPANPTKAGSVFDGWYSGDGETPYTANTSITGNVTLTAAWVKGFVDARDGQTYKTVEIGYQTWMAENLNYKFGNSWCNDDNEAMCVMYGRLYDWNTARNACPSGWHLPTREEWDMLVQYAGVGIAGTKLKSIGEWNSGGSASDALDSYGFSALPGGGRYDYGGSIIAGGHGYWWSATEYEYASSSAYYRSMEYNRSDVSDLYEDKGNGYSVRCVANN